MSDGPSLHDLFPTASVDAWQALATRALKGRDPDRLTRASVEGLPVAPLYAGAPEGAAALGGLARPGGWAQRAWLVAGDPVALAADAAEARARGAQGLWLQAADGGLPGAAAVEAAAQAGLPLLLDPGADGAPALRALQAAGGRGVVFTDPFGAAAAAGDPTRLPGPAGCDALAGLAAAATPQLRTLGVDGTVVAEAGGDAALELAFAIGAADELLAALAPRGVGAAAVGAAVELRLSLGRDQLLGLARLRAARLLWARLFELHGAPGQRPQIHGVQLRRGLTRRDPWTNLLRGTLAGFIGAVGGADAVTVLPFDAALGQPDALGRKLAAGTQLLLEREAHLGALTDPAAGSHAVEALTAQLCAAAWAHLQAWSREGGLAAALRSGTVQAQVRASAATRARAFATRAELIVGVSEQPLLDEVLPARAPWPPRPAPTGPLPALLPGRDAAPFEALRDRADAAGRPEVLLVRWGPAGAAPWAARVGFTEALLAAGGLRARRGPPGDEVAAHAAAFAAAFAEGVRVAVICGDEADYPAALPALGPALAAVGPVLVAGPAPAAPWPGVRRHLSLGCDALDVLADLHQLLGV